MRLIFTLALLPLIASAQVTSTRTTPYDWQCQDSAGVKISDHQRFDTAFVACLNNPAGTYIQGGRYRITRVTDGTAALNWTAPTRNVDGSTLTNLSGYRIVYGRSPDALTGAIEVGNVTSYTVRNLDSGLWYFSVIALTATSQSAPSNVASKAL